MSVIMKTAGGSVLAILGLMLLNTAAQAQSLDIADSPKLLEWQYERLYEEGGLRADYLITEEVFGANGNEIGNVEDAIVNQHGQVVALIIEVGDFWKTPVTNIVVPWKKVKLVSDGIKVPVTADNYEQYLLFGDGAFVTLKTVEPVNDTLATAAETWKLTALMGDYVFVDRTVGYGYVSDVVLSKAGKIRAVVVNSSVKGPAASGRYAFPFKDYMFGEQPFDNIYILPYGTDEIKAMERFDYGEFDAYWD